VGGLLIGGCGGGTIGFVEKMFEEDKEANTSTLSDTLIQ
jgi:hypothetical protein